MKTWPEIWNSEPLVRRILQDGGEFEDVICALIQERDLLREKVMELDAIAPKKRLTSDGRIMVWHCPNELIPLTP